MRDDYVEHAPMTGGRSQLHEETNFLKGSVQSSTAVNDNICYIPETNLFHFDSLVINP